MIRAAGRALLVSLALSIALTPAAQAQYGGTVEIVPLAQYAFYPDSFALNSGVGVGGALGLFVTRRLSLEAAASYSMTNLPDSSPVRVTSLTGRFLVHLPLQGRASALFGIGYTTQRFTRGLDESQNGVAGLAGLRFGFGPRLGLRLEATAGHLAPAGGTADAQWNVEVQAGVSMFMGRVGPRDSDHDGVPNSQDRCPGTAPGLVVDPTGCALPTDSDGDGVLDGADKCPGTPAGQRVDITGCNADLDGDGVPNALDRCPATPPGAVVDQFGCPPARPPADTDADGIPDDQDRCPGTPAGTPVDALGCPRPVARPAPAPRLILSGVTFPTGSAALSPAARSSLRRTAESLLADPGDRRLEVAGYTDDTGSRAVNELLSLQRAESVRRFLIEAGVAADRLTARGYGPADPIASNATAEGRELNRRVELRPID
jgi:outer membrane protein OmpA-like peptidoglycan-associated protein